MNCYLFQQKISATPSGCPSLLTLLLIKKLPIKLETGNKSQQCIWCHFEFLFGVPESYILGLLLFNINISAVTEPENSRAGDFFQNGHKNLQSVFYANRVILIVNKKTLCVISITMICSDLTSL